MRAGLAALCAALFACSPAAAEPWPGNGSWKPDPARYKLARHHEDVRMSDGTILSAVVNEPVDPSTGELAPGPFPVLLSITPYVKEVPYLQGIVYPRPEQFVPRGYIHVLVDTRGTGGSEGAFELFGPREVRDYVETIDWVAKLPRSNGRVGMVGASYLGTNQLMAAGAVGPGSPLRAIAPQVAGNDLYRDLSVPGGIFNNLFDTPYAGLEVGMDTLGPALEPREPGKAFDTQWSHFEGNRDIDFQTLNDAVVGGDRAYDGDFWRARRPASYFPGVVRNRIPTLVFGAWFDIWQRGGPLIYTQLQNSAAGRAIGAPNPRRLRPDPRIQIVMQPRTHGSVSDQLFPLLLEWYDTWLKGRRTGMARTSTPFHAYEIGARRWVETTAWPPPAARVRSLWFGPGRTGTAPLSGNDGSLTAKPPAAGGFDTVRWTGANSPCSRMTDQELIWGFLKTEQDTVGFGYENDCTFDDRSAAAGSLTYTSRPLERPLTIAGPGNVTVYAKATTKNTQWVVTLDDVAPDGGSRPLATGDLIGSLRALDRRRTWFLDGKPIAPYHPFTRASEAAVTPGTVTRYDVELPSILARIAKGHRIRILVQTSDRPYLEPKGPDTAQLFGGVYEVQRTPLAASFANLPVVAPERLRTSTVDWGDCVTDC